LRGVNNRLVKLQAFGGLSKGAYLYLEQHEEYYYHTVLPF